MLRTLILILLPLSPDSKLLSLIIVEKQDSPFDTPLFVGRRPNLSQTTPFVISTNNCSLNSPWSTAASLFLGHLLSCDVATPFLKARAHVLGQILPEEKEKGAIFLESPRQGSWGFPSPSRSDLSPRGI